MVAPSRARAALGLLFVGTLLVSALAHPQNGTLTRYHTGLSSAVGARGVDNSSMPSLSDASPLMGKKHSIKSLPGLNPLPKTSVPSSSTDPVPAASTTSESISSAQIVSVAGTETSVVTVTVDSTILVPAYTVTSQASPNSSSVTTGPNSASSTASQSIASTYVAFTATSIQQSSTSLQGITSTYVASAATSMQRSSTQPTSLSVTSAGASSQPAVLTILPVDTPSSQPTALTILPASSATVLNVEPVSTTSSLSTSSTTSSSASPSNTSDLDGYYPAQLSKHPDTLRRRYVYTIAYSVAASAAQKMLNDLAAMQECQDITWCRSAIWSWLSQAAQQSVMRSSIAEDEKKQKPCDEVCLTEHAIEGSSRAALYMKQKIYKLITAMRRLPTYEEVDWDDIAPREKAATDDINEHISMLQKGSVVEHDEVVKFLKTTGDEPLDLPSAGTKPGHKGAKGSRSIRNLISGLDEVPGESLRSLLKGPPEPQPEPPSGPSPSGPSPPMPTFKHHPNNGGVPRWRRNGAKLGKVIQALKKIARSLKFKNLLRSIKDMFKKASKPPPKEPTEPARPPWRGEPTRDPLEATRGQPLPHERPHPKAPEPKPVNPADAMDDWQYGNWQANGFQVNPEGRPVIDTPKGLPSIKIDKPNRQMTLGGFGEPKLRSKEPVAQEQFDPQTGDLNPSNTKLAVPDKETSWDKDTIEALDREFLEQQGLIRNIQPHDMDFGSEDGYVVQSSQGLYPANGHMGKGKKWNEVPNADAADCASSRMRSSSGGCPLSAPEGLSSLVMDGVGPILDTFGQPIVSTVGADGIRVMRGLRQASDGAYHLLDDAGNVAKDAGSLVLNAATGLLGWLAPHHGHHKPKHTGHHSGHSTKTSALTSHHQTTLQTRPSTSKPQPTGHDNTSTGSTSKSGPSGTSQSTQATTMPRSTGNTSNPSSFPTSTLFPTVTGGTSSAIVPPTGSTQTGDASTASGLPTATPYTTVVIGNSTIVFQTGPNPTGSGSGLALTPITTIASTSSVLVIQPAHPETTPAAASSTLVVSPYTETPKPWPTHFPMLCAWQNHKLRDYEVWSNPSLPPGCSPPIFYECTSSWLEYIGCTQKDPGPWCKKLRGQTSELTAQCPKKDHSGLSSSYLENLSFQTDQENFSSAPLLAMGQVWRDPNVAPGCSEKVLWECTGEWQRWFYEGTGVPEWKWKFPDYCSKEKGEALRGHDEAVWRKCGYRFEAEGCKEVFLGWDPVVGHFW